MSPPGSTRPARPCRTNRAANLAARPAPPPKQMRGARVRPPAHSQRELPPKSDGRDRGPRAFSPRRTECLPQRRNQQRALPSRRQRSPQRSRPPRKVAQERGLPLRPQEQPRQLLRGPEAEQARVILAED